MKRILFFAMLAVLLLMQGCGGTAASVEPAPRPVKTMVVNEGESRRHWTFAGTAEDALETDLSFRVGGKIVSFPGEQIGRKFVEGEVIAQLDPSDYELEYRQANANLEQVRANYVRAKADLERNTMLFDRNVISRGELDQIQADFKSYQAQLSASSKQLDIARKRLTYTTLRAPFDGWIGKVETHVHQNVASGQSVASLNAGRQMKMYISVPDMLISQVSVGDEVDVRFDALPGQTMRGKVMEVSVGSNTGSSYPVKVYLDNADKTIRSGMSGNVSFLGQSAVESRFFIPSVAVVGESDGTQSVWVVDEKNSTVMKKKVSVGKLAPQGIEIIDGVQSGDVIVIRGVHRLKAGLKVRYSKNETEG